MVGSAPSQSRGARASCRAGEGPLSDPVRLELREHTALVTLDRPDVLNALDTAMLEAILLRIEEAGRDPRTRALVVTGAGKAFAAGADITAMSHMGAG